jgi:hypothetical protein
MVTEHLGKIVDLDPRTIALENSLVRALRTHGPLRQRDLWYRSSAPRHGRERFEQAVNSLVERRIIVRQGTNHINSFILRMAPDKRRRAKHDAVITTL